MVMRSASVIPKQIIENQVPVGDARGRFGKTRRKRQRCWRASSCYQSRRRALSGPTVPMDLVQEPTVPARLEGDLGAQEPSSGPPGLYSHLRAFTLHAAARFEIITISRRGRRRGWSRRPRPARGAYVTLVIYEYRAARRQARGSSARIYPFIACACACVRCCVTNLYACSQSSRVRRVTEIRMR